MPAIEVHVRDSLARTGKEYREVHEWIDKDETKKVERHDIKRLLENSESVKSMWGEEAAREYLMHVHDDVKAKFEHVQHDFGKAISDILAYFGIK